MKFLLPLLLLASLPAAADKPNILWIIAEDMSPDLGCYGNKLVTTPHLDQLAADGMLFERAFTTGPACSPSRTSLATGVYQTTLGAYHMRYSKELLPPLPAPVKLLPVLLREQGYFTGNIKEVCETGTGKDDFLFQTDQKPWDTRSWDELIKHQPFFGQINFSESHRSFKRNKTSPISTEKITLPPYYPDHAVSREDWAGYLEEINTADEHVGRILKQLEQDGLADNTIVCFIGDHGRPMIRAKNWLYDSGSQVPLIIHFPKDTKKPARYKAGSRNSELIVAIDLVAETLLMAGIEIPDWMQGRSILQEDSKPRKAVYTAVDRIGNIDSCSRAVRTDRFKYIRNFKRPGSVNECSTYYRRTTHPIYHLLRIMNERGELNPVQQQLLKRIPEEELYDLEKDPFETVNLIGNPAFTETHKTLRSDLDVWIKNSGDKGLAKDSPAIVEHFRNYGINGEKKTRAGREKRRAAVQAHFE